VDAAKRWSGARAEESTRKPPPLDMGTEFAASIKMLSIREALKESAMGGDQEIKEGSIRSDPVNLSPSIARSLLRWLNN
jgi:hypothetical protein